MIPNAIENDVWRQCCDAGPENIFMFKQPRRSGTTTMMHTIATKGLDKKLRVLTVHINERNKFKDTESTTFGSVEFLNDYDVLCIDDCNYMTEANVQRVIEYIQNKEWTNIFLFCSGDKEAPLLESAAKHGGHVFN